jgi:hypothetical protein
MKFSKRLLQVGCLAAVALHFSSSVEVGQLNMAPVFQPTPVWCWLASTETSLKHYGVPDLNPGGDDQCGTCR